jgi:RNA polymerase sigma factor (sigma-70 family)
MGSPLDAMLSAYGRLPIPSREEQVLLGRAVRAWLDWEPSPEDQAAGRTEPPARVRRAGERAREQLVSRNMLLVARQAAAFSVSSMVAIERQDLIQEGAIGLCRAAEMFDPARGFAFSTFAVWWIRQSITRLVHTSGSIRIPVKRSQAMHGLRQWVEAFTAREGRSPSDEEAMAALALTPGDLAILRKAAAIRHVGSLDAVMGDGDGDSWGSSVAAPEPDTAPLAGDQELDLVLHLLGPWPDLREVMSRLLSRQCYGEISAAMGVSLPAARRLGRQARAMARRLVHEAAQRDQLAESGAHPLLAVASDGSGPQDRGEELEAPVQAALPIQVIQQLTLDLWDSSAGQVPSGRVALVCQSGVNSTRSRDITIS